MNADAERKVLFDGADLVIVSVDGGRGRGVVTFGPWLANPLGSAPAEQARGFVERAFERQAQADELHIIPRRNHWYNCAERNTAVDFVASFAASRRVVTCGSSMGGYGSALFSALLGLPCISVSPQFSLAPEYAPFETRWRDEFKQIESFDSETMFHNSKATGYIFYDPFTELDARQAQLFRGRSDLQFVPCPFSGHATVAMMNKSYGLARIASEVLSGTFEIRNLLDARRNRRRGDDLYLTLLYIQAGSRGHRALSESLRIELEDKKGELGLNPHFPSKALISLS
ncbi:hypothetical protein [Paracoccus sp. TOH]|uniref:hypothetical protein n=1 Tax=Paracoccus sp. TOH TaxID=1263728 RepID=UPI0025B018E7|nr:hypothetical protein [Paracoccus sp. TOH]WJS85330.1 hypothetical protein NBE95_14220 [Paracoccus sp. TOH]